jgi:hypothetical protein
MRQIQINFRLETAQLELSMENFHFFGRGKPNFFGGGRNFKIG